MVLSFLYSCINNNEENAIKDKSNNKLEAEKFFMGFILNPYKKENIRFNYPYETTFRLHIYNNSKNKIKLKGVDSLDVMYATYYVYSICRYNDKTYKMYMYKGENMEKQSKKRLEANKNESLSLAGYFIEFPLYDSIYSKSQFRSFIDDFKKNAKFYVFTDNDKNNIETINVGTDSVRFDFSSLIHGGKGNIGLDKIGYPDSMQLEDKEVWIPETPIGSY